MMLLFIDVQYNDRDGLMWGLIYLAPTVWAGLATIRLDRVTTGRPGKKRLRHLKLFRVKISGA